MAVAPQVGLVGARSLRRDLNRMIPGTGKLVTGVLRETIQPLAADARSRAPVGTGENDPHPGQLRDRLRGVAYSTNASIRDTLPYAPVHEFGGTIRPKGTPIKIEGKHFVYDAIDAQKDDIIAKLTEAFGPWARRYGWT